MLLRLLFVFLCALNIAVGAWLLLGRPYVQIGMPTDPGVPELHLLSELPASAVSASSQALGDSTPLPADSGDAPAHAAASPGSHCLSLGPFATPQDLRSARLALGDQVIRMRSRQEQTTQAGSWWVYLPAAANRAGALKQARDLSAHRISDYFVVSAGDQPNAISLGLFKDPANARKRRDEVIAAGFPARMTERTETVPQYWLDLVVAPNARFDWRQRLGSSGIGSHSSSCF